MLVTELAPLGSLEAYLPKNKVGLVISRHTSLFQALGQ